MNTPGHAVVNLVVLGRKGRAARDVPVLLGAVAPDLPIALFYLWTRVVRGIPDSRIWGEVYFEPQWKLVFDLSHSIPLALLLFGVGRWLDRERLQFFSASLILHSLLDLPLHHDDAHSHFRPFTDFRLESPISYWDPDRHGVVVGSVEAGLVVALSAFILFPRLRGLWWRGGLALAVSYYLLLLAWIHGSGGG